jgi:ABC-type Fe3+/spermidine/putrescine transport system ATPase subunit
VLKLVNVSKFFHHQSVVDAISFILSSAQVAVILGKSGSGKSTLLKMIAGLLEPSQGKLWLEDQPIFPAIPRLIPGHPRIRLVSQDFQLFHNLPVREQILHPIRLLSSSLQSQRLIQLLSLTGLKALQHRLPRELSGGEQQRTAIAQALAAQPSLLLLDEPFSQLDRENRQVLRHYLQDIPKKLGTSLLIVSHDLSDAYALADTLLLMRKGKLIQQGPPEQVYHFPTDAYTARFTGAVNLLPSSHPLIQPYSPPNARSLACLRPEHLAIVPEKAGNTWQVLQCLFQGDHYLLELKGGLQVWTRDPLALRNKIGIKIIPDQIHWV